VPCSFRAVDTNRNSKVSDSSSSQYADLLKDLSQVTHDLVKSEAELVKTELQASLPTIARYTSLTGIFSFFLASSVIPFLAFVVICLGVYLDGQYWLSALIVSAVMAVISAPLAYFFFKKLKHLDYTFQHSRQGISKGLDVVQEKVAHVLESSKGTPRETELH
jgi:uncharacterized membrane protein YqjE